jgi:hypothetical protein
MKKKTKWAIFTHSGKEIKKITKLLEETQIGIALQQESQYKPYLSHAHKWTNTEETACTK